MPRVDLQKYNKKVENPFAILWRLVCYFKHCRLLLTAAMLSILAYVAATIGAAYCMKPLTNLLETSGAAPNETYAKYISLILGLAGLYLLSALTNYLLNRLMLECSAIIMKQLRTELFDTMQRQPVRFLTKTRPAPDELLHQRHRATNELLQHSITQLAISITSLVGTVAMMLACPCGCLPSWWCWGPSWCWWCGSPPKSASAPTPASSASPPPSAAIWRR